MQHVILITGASSGFGLLSAHALAEAGHTVYASTRDTTGKNADKVAAIAGFAKERRVDLRSLDLDVGSEGSVDAAVASIVAEHGRIEVVMHNAGHMVMARARLSRPTSSLNPTT